MREEDGLIAVTLILAASASIVILLVPISAEASLNSPWRYDSHSRSIDIDICIRCTSTVPGPQGPPGPPGEQGPPGDTRQTIVTLHDDAEGNAAGWIPMGGLASFEIKAPVELNEEISLEASYLNTDSSGGSCGFGGVNTASNSFLISCPLDGSRQASPLPGAILTYIITK
jgi:hypothetical protein